MYSIVYKQKMNTALKQDSLKLDRTSADRSSMKTLMLVLMLLSFTGCSHAYWVKRNHDPKGGVVAFRNEGWGIEKRRKQAEQLMTDHCSPEPYRLVSESFGVNNSGVMFTGSMALPIEESHASFHFACGLQKEPVKTQADAKN